jgi:hypothetical protein
LFRGSIATIGASLHLRTDSHCLLPQIAPSDHQYNNQMNTKIVFRPSIVITALFFSILFPAVAQTGVELNMAVLSKKLQLTDQQKKQLAPIVEQRDKEIKALKANTSLGKLQKLRKAEEIQTSFRDQAAKILNPDQIKKLDELQAERRAKLVGH